MEHYNCVHPSWVYDGPEMVHILNAHTTMDIHARLSLAATDLDVFILDAADPNACVAYNDYDHAIYAGAPPGTYYIVVDGFNGEEGSYTLEISCPGATTATPTYTPTPTPRPSAVPGSMYLPRVSKPLPPTPTPTPAFQARINCGGAQYTDHLGQVWEADRQYAPGGYGYSGGAAFNTDQDIANTDDDPLYQTERAGGEYRFDVPNGTYEVTLLFTEFVQHLFEGHRVFDVLLEGEVALWLFDIYAEAGGRYIALPKVLTVHVGDGQLNLTYVHRTKDTYGTWGKLDAIAVKGTGP